MHIDNVGWAITGDGQETIAARESKMFAPRVQVNDALIMGRTAWKVGSDGFSLPLAEILRRAYAAHHTA